MALHDPVITLESVTPNLPERFMVTLRLVIPDNDVTAKGIDQTYSLPLKQGVAIGINNVTFREMMNSTIKEYKRAEAIRNNANWANAITAIKNGVVV